jgi:hypothetical protein
VKQLIKRLLPAAVIACLAVGLVAGTASAAGKDSGAASVSKAKKAKRGPRGKTGATGATGATGKTGATGPKGDKGDKGERGERGEAGPFPGTLPSGVTIRGTYAIATHQNTAGEFHADAQSFGFTLASPPTPHFVAKGTAPPAQCPGSASNPQAVAGSLCVYEGVEQNRTSPTIFNPANGISGSSGTSGFAVDVTGGASTSENILSYGTWAVTAP